MKRTFLTLLSVLFCAVIFAQSVPQGINYQAVARDASGDVLMNQALTIQLSVISDITTSAVSWQETHAVTTNDYGLFTAIIGQGTTTSVGSSTTFDVIDWGASNHLLKVEIDYGSGYLDMGTTAFMSVPYAINSTPQSLSISGDTIFISNGDYVLIPGLNLVNNLIIYGCIDTTSSSYNALANTDDGTCCVDGCTDASACNYDANATCDDGSCYYTPLAIGDNCQGGIVFYLDGNGGGLIAAPTDQPTGAEWGCYGTSVWANGTAIGTGAQNTVTIVQNGCASSSAASMCANYDDGTYDDWFLPSKDELNEMYLNIGQGNALGLGNIGGFVNNAYWSSTESSSTKAWYEHFSNGYQNKTYKSFTYKVRAIRAF
jgi:hypothetical protein